MSELDQPICHCNADLDPPHQLRPGCRAYATVEEPMSDHEPHPLTEAEAEVERWRNDFAVLRRTADELNAEVERLTRWKAEAIEVLVAWVAEVERLPERERAASEKAWDEVERLRGVVARVEAIHKPIRVYDECDHDPDHGCEPIEVYDYIGCSESVIGWACEVCCYDDEHPREDCPHDADHQGVAREQSCPTFVALRSADREGQA